MMGFYEAKRKWLFWDISVLGIHAIFGSLIFLFSIKSLFSPSNLAKKGNTFC